MTPWLFRLPPWRRYDGFATHRIIFLRSAEASDDLVTHELCHVWQMQHRPLVMPLSYLRTGYRRSPYERQAREAARADRQERPVGLVREREIHDVLGDREARRRPR